MKAIIPAAGYATRMWPLTKNRAKSLLEVVGKPLIEYCLDRVVEVRDVEEVYVISNGKFYQDFLDWRDSLDFRDNVIVLNNGIYSRGESIGSVGDIRYALSEGNVKDDFLIINPDNLFSFDLRETRDYFFRREGSVLGMYDVGYLDQAKKLGNPVLDRDFRIVGFKEKDPDVTSSVCTVGIYFFEEKVRERIGEYLEEGNSRDRFGDFISWLYQKEKLHGFVFGPENKWFDVGSIESYEKVKKNWAGFFNPKK